MRRLSNDYEGAYPDYFVWLCELVCVDGRYTDESYWVLAKALWDTDYYYSLDMDADREADGLALRDRYAREGGTDGYDGLCTVLEVLVALADRMDTMFDELDGECKIPIFFWEMIENLGLGNYSDFCFEEHPQKRNSFQNRIDRKIEDWLDRCIDFNGYGGLFPLHHARIDQQGIDLWYQANAYMIENYL